jgi:hypothetical protein
MFDFQVVDDVGIAVRSIRRSAGRGRGWMA